MLYLYDLGLTARPTRPTRSVLHLCRSQKYLPDSKSSLDSDILFITIERRVSVQATVTSRHTEIAATNFTPIWKSEKLRLVHTKLTRYEEVVDSPEQQ